MNRQDLIQQLDALQPLLLRYAQRRCNDSEGARDMVQDALRRYLEVLREKGENAIQSPKSWLLKTLHHLVVDHYRKREGERSAMKELAERRRLTEVESTPELDLSEAWQSRLEKLPLREREVITLRIEQDLSYDEISDVTGLKRGYVGYLIHHALRRLRELVTEEELPKRGHHGLP